MAINKLVITVVDAGKGDAWGGNADVAPSSGNGARQNTQSKLYKALNYNQIIKAKIRQATSPATAFAVQVGIGLATQSARQFINYYMSDIGRANGDSNYAAQIGRRIEQVTDVASFVSGALSGAAGGAMFGGVGAVVGAAVGAASAGINLGFKYAGREREYQYQMFQENNRQSYNLARANYTALTGRVR